MLKWTPKLQLCLLQVTTLGGKNIAMQLGMSIVEQGLTQIA